MNYLTCFIQSSTASLKAMLSAPFFAPYFMTTLARNSRSNFSGSIITVLPILDHHSLKVSLCLNTILPNLNAEVCFK
jgi:hypothetical protein